MCQPGAALLVTPDPRRPVQYDRNNTKGVVDRFRRKATLALMIDERLQRAVMRLLEWRLADEREELVQMHGYRVGRRLASDFLEIAETLFLEGVDAVCLSSCFILKLRHTAVQVLFCLHAASRFRAFTEPVAFGPFTALLDLPDTALLAEPRHAVAFCHSSSSGFGAFGRRPLH